VALLAAWPVFSFDPRPLIAAIALAEPALFALIGLSIGADERPAWALPAIVACYLVPVAWGLATWEPNVTGQAHVLAFGGYLEFVLLWPVQVPWIVVWVGAIWGGLVPWT
jgi:hypothetical protein